MKKLLLLLALGLIAIGNAQNPELFDRTWYLYSIDYEIDPDVNIANFDPPIEPTLFINGSILTFAGDGACNIFEGSLSEEIDGFTVTERSNTTEPCTIYENEFEQGYFGFFSIETFFNTNISDNGDGEFTLTISGGPFTTLTYQSTPILSNRDLNVIKFDLAPNPTSDTLRISSEKNTIEKISTFNIAGQRVLEQNANLETVNVSALQNGIYFIEVTSENGKALKRFVKK